MQADVAEALRAALLATGGVTDFSRPAVTAKQLRDLVIQMRQETGAQVVLLADMSGGKSYHLNIIPTRTVVLPDSGGSSLTTTHDEMFVYISRFGPLAQRYWNRYSVLGEPTLFHTPPSPETTAIDAAVVEVIARLGVRFLAWEEANMPAPLILSGQPEGAPIGQLLFTAL